MAISNKKALEAAKMLVINKEARVLDVTCGSRGIWFDKNYKHAIYCDARREHHERTDDKGVTRKIDVAPDVQCNFTDLPFENNTFALVVFDPPHAIRLSEKSWLYKKYGQYDTKKDMMDNVTAGFRECMRVLKTDGTLVFKWAEVSVSAQDIIKAFGQAPLFGVRLGKKMGTHWMVFLKE